MLAMPLLDRVLSGVRRCEQHRLATARATTGGGRKHVSHTGDDMCFARCCVVHRRVLDNTGPKWALTAMHDVSIAPVLGALGVYDNRWPPLSSHVVFEVWGPPPPPSGTHKSLDGASTVPLPQSRWCLLAVHLT